MTTEAVHAQFTPVPENFHELSIYELQALRTTWFEEARRFGVIEAAREIARELGEAVTFVHGAKYRWYDADIAIYVDNFGGFLTVHTKGRCVLHTHMNEARCIPGPWMDVIATKYAEAMAKRRHRDASQDEQERQYLLKEIDPTGL